MDPAAAKQQIAERVKQSNKFLVTVNANPTVDQLAACIGLTLLLNKMGKHATAVFSGRVPNTIEFLQPEKTLQKNTDALRDFIISLDKNKADKLRYKVEDNVVRIFITPYRTSLSQKDLIFSDGDFNVEAVIALGVNQRTQLDSAITSHGRILHDATVISLNAGLPKAPDIGQINWVDPMASSLSEMLVSISEAFGPGLIDSQMATAFLTGIVAETERFSNKKTSPKVMTMSAQLMAAGANQQLIAEKLAPPPPPPPKPKPPEAPKKPIPPPKPKPPPLKPEGVINVPHDDDKKKDKADVELGTTEIHIDDQGNLIADQIVPPPFTELPHDIELPTPESTEPEPEHPEEPPAPAAWTAPPAPPVAPLAAIPSPPVTALPPAETPLPPQISQVRATESAQTPSALPTLPPPAPLPSTEPQNHHAFMGSTAQPGVVGIPFAPVPGQPDWAAPYDLVPMDPMREAGAVNSEFGSSPAAVNPEVSQNNFSQGHGVTPPPELTASFSTAPPASANDARSAVEQAIAAAPFDPAFGAPVQALNAQPMSPVPIHNEAPPAETNLPPLKTSDTPMLVLPTDNSSSVTATQPIATQTPLVQQPVSGVAPPPMPPPLNVAQPPR